MAEKVEIVVASIHMNDGEKNEMEMTYTGEYEQVGMVHIIKYNEYEDDKIVNYNTMFIKEDFMRVVKMGQVTSELIFIKDENTQTTYCTPYGNIEMGVKTHLICTDIAKNRINVKVLYSMLVGNDVISDTSMVVIIKKCDKCS
ncbi:MAG: DUF1934 domain-containing protein [Lachnospiraceae bacterium]|nr:DUF1934 domain-containing protein [Lachnospiraceae bacterium]